MNQLFRFLLLFIIILNLTGEIILKPMSTTEETTSTSMMEEITLSSKMEETTSTSSTPTRENLTLSALDFSRNEIDSEYRVKYAKQMLTFMNMTQDPCDDFYEYACGNWKNVIEERQAQHKRSNLLDIVYKLGDAVELLLQKSAESLQSDYIDEFKLTQKFYQSCLEAELYPMKKSQSYIDVINSIGGFPAVDETWKPDDFSWFNMSAHLTNYGVASLLREEIIPQYPFPPYFKLPELGFDYITHTDNIVSNTSRGYDLNEKRMKQYLTMYGVEESRMAQIISDVFEFWRAVLKVADRFNEDFDKCEVLSASLNTSSFNQWDNYMEIAWGGKDFGLAESLWPCDYFYVELDKICNERKEAVANYLAMRFLYRMDARLDDKKFQRDYCTMTVQYSLPYLIDKLYMEEHFNDDIRDEIAAIVNEIRKSLRDILEKADWLDEATRLEALLKETTISTHIGSYKNPVLTDRLIREMKNLTFVEGNYEQNNINLRKFYRSMKRYNGFNSEQYDERSAKPLELLVALQVNAFYYNVDNAIYVMAGILHPPAYHKAWPNSLKYGTIGYLVGHEFTHGFDTVGAMFDSNGEENYWWSNKSGIVFGDRSNCYVDHYNSYMVPEINRFINGNETKDENIADSGGLREALSAFRRHMKKQTKEIGQTLSYKEEQMPGLNLSPEQLFFLGFAQLWCASYKEEHYWEELSNQHTIDKYRVLGAVTNMEDFSKVYECPLGSKMNPKADKCRVW